MWLNEYRTKGHNIALSLGFSELFGNKDLSFSLLGLANLTKPKLVSSDSPYLAIPAVSDAIETIKNFCPRGIFSAMLNYSFSKNASMGFGPYITVADWKKVPTVAMKIDFKLGGGKF